MVSIGAKTIEYCSINKARTSHENSFMRMSPAGEACAGGHVYGYSYGLGGVSCKVTESLLAFGKANSSFIGFYIFSVYKH